MRYLLTIALSAAAVCMQAQDPDTTYITGSMSYSYCYTDLMDTSFIYSSTDGMPLFLKFCAGNMTACCDFVRLYDGPYHTDPLLFQNIENEDLTGVSVVGISGWITVQVLSDSSISCATEGYAPLAWVVGLNTDSMECLQASIPEPGVPTFSLYPVPADEVVSIVRPSQHPVAASLQLIDISGRAVATQRITGPRTEVDTRNLMPGLYMAVISSAEGRFARRFQVVH